MIVKVAGAGAGKTTKMADIIINQDIPEGKIIFCIAFTNAAANNIKEKIVEKLGNIPNNIKISTIHSFLYKELIEPYYYFLYKKHFRRISTIKLSTNNIANSLKLSRLEKEDILHITKIPEKAKWVVYKKSKDTKAIKNIRKKILFHFINYCSAIFVDEAQDINKDICSIFFALRNTGIKIALYGDPKQDIKGFGCFRHIIDETSNVKYISECYRCPQKHLDLSNTLAIDKEKQVADTRNDIGSIKIIFESNIDDLKSYVESANYGLCYISKKYKRFITHNTKEIDNRFELLHYEVLHAMKEKWENIKSLVEIERDAFFVTEIMLKEYDLSGNSEKQIMKWRNLKAFNQLSKQCYKQMISAFSKKEKKLTNTILVKSIDIIKGLEAEKCLFILTPDLAPYLFKTKLEDNKTNHLLYVALTRSKKHLSILITQEVEKSFSRNFIKEFFKKYSCEIEANDP